MLLLKNRLFIELYEINNPVIKMNIPNINCNPCFAKTKPSVPIALKLLIFNKVNALNVTAIIISIGIHTFLLSLPAFFKYTATALNANALNIWFELPNKAQIFKYPPLDNVYPNTKVLKIEILHF